MLGDRTPKLDAEQRTFIWKAASQGLAAIIIIVALVGGCTRVNQYLGLSDDNIFEETLEEQIQRYSGLEVDLSPVSPE